MTDYDAVKALLLVRRKDAADIRLTSLAGIYVLFISKWNLLPGVVVPPSDILYVGMTGSSLAARSHFDRPDSGFSTLRRSLGALLKSELNLRAIPRGVGPSPSNTTNYRFEEAGELRLTEWMRCNLTYNDAAVQGDLLALESRLIAEFEPPLNLTGWANPQRAWVRTLRTTCRDEARVSAQKATLLDRVQ